MQSRSFGISRVKRSEEHTSELQSPCNLVCRLLLEKKKKQRRETVRRLRPSRRARRVPAADVGAVAHVVRRRIQADGRLVSACHGFFFFFNDTATTEIYTLSLHDALPI